MKNGEGDKNHGKRAAGILMPISSLPSDYGIGCFSKEAYEFVDQLALANQNTGRFCHLDQPVTEIPLSVFFHLCRKSLFYRFKYLN